MTGFRIAVVGSGPSGFYAAEALLRSGRPIAVDMFERLPVPFGLVRFGVAPDHAKLKQVTAVYNRIAAMPGYRFIGGVEVGTHLTVETLLSAYHAVVLANGAAEGRAIGIPGEALPGSHQAGDFVGWFNGHPDCRDCRFDFSAERAVIVGHGNVALDVARILMKTPDELRSTDIASHALQALSQSRIREALVVGRRGPAETRFSFKELQEFEQLTACDASVDESDLDASSFFAPAGGDAETCAAIELIAKFSKSSLDKPRRCVFRFHLEPTSLIGEAKVEQAVFRSARQATPVAIPCGLVFLSVGRRTTSIRDVPYDLARGVHANDGGRIVADGALVPRLYACGWCKRGPSGVIGSNRACAVDTVEKLIADLDSCAAAPLADAEPLVAAASRRHGVRLDFAAWRLIDAAEVERGRTLGKPREKFVSIDEMISAAQERDIAC